MKQIRILVGEKKDSEGIVTPIYRNIPIENEYLRFYEVMEKLLFRVGKIELSLLLFLAKNVKDNGIVYNNQLVRDEFRTYIKEKSNNKASYSEGTIHQAFSNLKNQGVLVSIDKVATAYWLNPAFIFKGSEQVRNSLIITIDNQEHGKIIRTEKELAN